MTEQRGGQNWDYIEQMYASGDDPWRIGTGFYEERKRRVLLACLPQPRFRRAFEPACASGELTAALADRCDALLAADVADRAVQLTQQRMRDRPAVRVSRLEVPRQWPDDERFDLVVLSEFGYYLPEPQWHSLAVRCAAGLAPDWTVLACHWRGRFPERLIDTDSLHATLDAALPGRRTMQVVDDDFRLDVWSSAASTVASRDQRA